MIFSLLFTFRGIEDIGDESKASKGWMSMENDYENSYTQLGYRTYDPNIGRFLQVDPMFEKFPDASPYNYCYNSPMIAKDPTGLAMQLEDFAARNGEANYIFDHAWEAFMAYSRMMDIVADIANKINVERNAEEASSSGRTGESGAASNGFGDTPSSTPMGQTDTDGDGITDDEDSDIDGDGIVDNIVTEEVEVVESYQDNTEIFNNILEEIFNKYSDLHNNYKLQPSIQMGEFISDFKPGGKYDLKLQFTKSYWNNKLFKPDDYGNFAFGFAGSILGIDLGSLIMSAGIVQMTLSNIGADWSNFEGFFDQKNDTPLIKRGYYYGEKYNKEK